MNRKVQTGKKIRREKIAKAAASYHTPFEEPSLWPIEAHPYRDNTFFMFFIPPSEIALKI